MSIDPSTLKRLIDEELEAVEDERVQRHVRSLLVEPEGSRRPWNYGPPGQTYICWIVLKHEPSSTAISYCEEGFGPRCPWGLLWLSGHLSMGDDAAWFTSFMDAYFDSRAPTELPIWRVFKGDRSVDRAPISEELPWDVAWKQIEDLRAKGPESRYDCDHTIKYKARS